jgi:hypothetical protein
MPIRFDHEFDFAYRGDRVQGTLSTDPRYTSCVARSMTILDRESVGVPMPPPNLRTPYEMFVLAGGGCTPGTLSTVVAAALEIPEDVGDLWVYQAGTGWLQGGQQRHCVVVNGTVPCPAVGAPPPQYPVSYFHHSVLFPLSSNGSSVFAVAAIAYPQFDIRATDIQDMWWAGPSEAGWGLTIAKNADRLFVAGFIYDQFGKPMWIVMPNGQWDPNTLVFYGDLFIPKSNPYTTYAGAGLDMRAPVGKGSLSFLGADDGHFDYTIGGYAGGKTISRYKFAPAGKDRPPYAGIWWGGANQEGWGVSVAQQGETIFATWYTYGQDFEPIWFFMPAGKKTAEGTYSGTLYRTTGTTWPGAHYNGASTQVIAAGTMQLVFDAKALTGTMTTVVDGKTLVNPIQRFDF